MAASARSVDAAGLPEVPLLVQPCSWSAETNCVAPSGCVIVPTRSALSWAIVVTLARSSAIDVMWKPLEGPGWRWWVSPAAWMVDSRGR